MHHSRIFAFFLLLLASITPSWANAAPETFEKAKVEARKYVYADRNDDGTFYCGCDWTWTGKSGGRVDLQSCGYKIRAQKPRAERIEWEHIVPASNFGRARQCWQNGGRENCNNTDPVFNKMEADLHNLTPAIGEVNADRSNYDFGVIPGSSSQYGACQVEINSSARVAEPRDEIKGQIARTYFYMFDRYNLRMSRQQQQLMMAWDKEFPVSAWEKERNSRITARMGHTNPFVTGEKRWTLNHENSGDGTKSVIAAPTRVVVSGVSQQAPEHHYEESKAIKGNKNSRIYHLPSGCPSYHQINAKNIVTFQSESEAKNAGYRKAGNCK